MSSALGDLPLGERWSSRAPVTGWHGETCTSDAVSADWASHFRETRTGSPAPGPVTCTRSPSPGGLLVVASVGATFGGRAPPVVVLLVAASSSGGSGLVPAPWAPSSTAELEVRAIACSDGPVDSVAGVSSAAGMGSPGAGAGAGLGVVALVGPGAGAPEAAVGWSVSAVAGTV